MRRVWLVLGKDELIVRLYSWLLHSLVVALNEEIVTIALVSIVLTLVKFLDRAAVVIRLVPSGLP